MEAAAAPGACPREWRAETRAVAARAVGSEEAVVQPPELGLTQELLALQNQDLSMAGTTNRFFGGFFWPDADTDPRAVRRITGAGAVGGWFHRFHRADR